MANTRTITRDVTVKPAPFAKGKGADKRNVSLLGVAPAAFIEGKSRADTLAVIRDALGNKPTDVQVNAVKAEYVIGRVAFRLFLSLPVVEGIAKARDIVLHFASPVKDGVAARKLRAGQKGRRTVEQHRAVRAAEEAWSQVKAEACPAASNAATQKERNAKKATRAPSMAGSGKGKATPPTHAELIKPLTAADTVQHVATQAASLLAFANKNAKLLPAGIAAAVKAFNATVQKDAAAFASLNA